MLNSFLSAFLSVFILIISVPVCARGEHAALSDINGAHSTSQNPEITTGDNPLSFDVIDEAVRSYNNEGKHISLTQALIGTMSFDCIGDTPEEIKCREDLVAASFEDFIKMYPEAEKAINTSEDRKKMQSDPMLRINAMHMIEKRCRVTAALNERACGGSWMKIPTTCFAYKVGRSGLPMWAGLTVVYGTWLVSGFSLIFLIWSSHKIVLRKITLIVRNKKFRTAVSLYLGWIVAVILTNNFTFRDVLNFYHFNNETTFLLLTLTPTLAAVGYGLFTWCRKGID